MAADRRLLSEALPMFYKEIMLALNSGGEADLARQLPDLSIARRCACGQSDCSSFYVDSRALNVTEAGATGGQHERSMALDMDRGMVVIDLDGFGGITFFEVLDRRDVFEELSRLDM